MLTQLLTFSKLNPALLSFHIKDTTATMTKVKNKPTVQESHGEDEIMTTLDQLSEFFKDMSSEVEVSKAMHGLNVSTNIIRGIEKSIKNPLKALDELYTFAEDNAKTHIHGFVFNFLVKNKEIIESAFIEDKSGSLDYFVFLSQYSIKNEGQILSFLAKYHHTEYYDRIPVFFHVFPSQYKENIPNLIPIEIQ